MEPTIGTNAYLFSLLNPFQRPLFYRYVNGSVLKIFGVLSVLIFAVLSWFYRGHGLLGVGVASVLTMTYMTGIAVGVELLWRVAAVSENFEVRLSNRRSLK